MKAKNALRLLTLTMLPGCGDWCLFKSSCEEVIEVEPELCEADACSDDADGVVTCACTSFEDSLDAVQILGALHQDDGPLTCSTLEDEDDLSETGDTGDSGDVDFSDDPSENLWLCAATGLLSHKAQSFSTGDTATVGSAFEDVEEEVADRWGYAPPSARHARAPTGSCPDTLTGSVNSVFDVACEYADQPQPADEPSRLSWLMNGLQDDMAIQTLGSRPGLGIWLQVGLQNDAASTSATGTGDDIWFTIFWSMNHFRTLSALHFQSPPGSAGSDGCEYIVAIRGLSVAAMWSSEAAREAGYSTSQSAATAVRNFMDSPLTTSAPGFPVRLVFSRVDFADFENGAATWAPSSSSSSEPTPLLNSCSKATPPWHAVRTASLPVAIIDPVVSDEIDELAAFVQGARDESWTVVFEGDDP